MEEFLEELVTQLIKLKALIPGLIGLVKVTIPCLIIAGLFYGAYRVFFSYYAMAKANEWLVVVRHGEQKYAGVGIAQWTFPLIDKTVTFPSVINQVNFTANQVSKEMQGVEVTGMGLWSVYRKDEGPANCFRTFGEDLNKPTPHIANGKIEAMAVAVIRDSIANSSINDILKSRSVLRDRVQSEMQKILTGWGIWLETCEIQDVKITSKSLFTNLQSEFREQERGKAERISSDAQRDIDLDHMTRGTDFQMQTFEHEKVTQEDGLQKNEDYKMAQTKTTNKEQNEKLQRDTDYSKKKAELDNLILIEKLVREAEYQKSKMESDTELKLEKIERDASYSKTAAETKDKRKVEKMGRDFELNKKVAHHENLNNVEALVKGSEIHMVDLKIQKQKQETAAKQKIEHRKNTHEVWLEEVAIKRDKRAVQDERETEKIKVCNKQENWKQEKRDDQELWKVDQTIQEENKTKVMNNDDELAKLEIKNEKFLKEQQLYRSHRQFEKEISAGMQKFESDQQRANETVTHELEVKKIIETRQLTATQHKSNKQDTINDLAVERLVKGHDFWRQKHDLQMKTDFYKENILKGMIIQKTLDNYLGQDDGTDMRVINLEGSDDAKGMGQILAAYKAIAENLEAKD